MKDFLGNDLKEGDIVLRPKFKSFTLHKIKRFTKKRIELSVRRVTKLDLHKKEYLWLEDSRSIKDISTHNGLLFILKEECKINLIKYGNII